MTEGTSKEEQFVTDWKAKIRAGKKFRKKYSTFKHWKDYRNYYRSNWKEGLVPVNRIFSYGRSMIPAIYSRHPRVVVTPTKPEFEMHAMVVEEIDNWLIRECLLKYTLKRASLHTYLCGTGPIKLGFDSEFGFLPEQMVGEDGSTVTQVGEKEFRNIEYNTSIKPGCPWAADTLPDEVIVPYGYPLRWALPWVAHRIYRPLDDVKQDQKYKNTDGLQGTKISDLDDVKKSNTFLASDNMQICELYEIRDARRKMVHVLCEDKMLLSQLDELQIDGMPWEFLQWNDDPEHFWAIPDVKIIEPQQLELNDIRTQASRHRAIDLLKFLYKRGAIKEEDLENFFSGAVGPGIPVDDDVIGNVITMIQPGIPRDLSVEAARVNQDIRESLGFSENELGQFSPYHGKTATETNRVAGSHDNRIDERRDIVTDTMVNIIRKWNQYIFKFWTQERVARIAGADGAMHWISYTGDQLAGEYNLLVDPDSGMPISTQVRMEASTGLMKMYAGDQMVDQTMLRQKHLQQFEWIFPGISRALKTAIPQMQADMLSVARQPHPQGGKGAAPIGNRGGGGGNVTPLANFKSKSQGGG